MKQVKRLASLVLALALGVVSFAVPADVLAGTDLDATCPAFGTCSISPTGTPLLDEAAWTPGDSVTQRFSVTNSSTSNGFVGIEVQNYTETKNLGDVIDVEIREGSPTGTAVYTGVTLSDFNADGFFTIDAVSAGQTIDYYLVATMQTTAGNEYQAASTIFDLGLGLEVASIPPSSGGGDGGGGSGGTGGTSPASPPVCNANPPSSAPTVTITNVTTNTVSLSWTEVNPVTHYALVFTRNSDGEQYGSPNIGNVTSFTVENLSGGANYSFQVFGVNDCAPGELSALAESGTVPGPFIASRPTGGGQVLGENSDDEDATASATTEEQPAGEVAGVNDTCAAWTLYLPWVLLIAQAVLLLASEFFFRRDTGLTKQFFAVGITLLSIVLFYLLRNCNCYDTQGFSFLVWLCTWYWIVAAALTAVIKVFSYAFIEEVDTTAEDSQ